MTFSAIAETDARARADRRALEQVFSNFYDNALRYTDEGGRIRVTTSRTETEPGQHADNGSRVAPGVHGRDAEPRSGPWVVVEVADSGTGI
ncbi:MAG: hypothetical protein GWN71_31620, partial [Gammaproteobacteria bacterium]|nr:hypothetical protein [Gemmatimonadota bacterium]NIU77939.1 hypothetical protein [Gammaproteobacteria bacterium]